VIFKELGLLKLETKRGRPIVLVGGTNGAGKTTLLEALLLCLYGRRALGPRVSEASYEKHLRSRFHVQVDGTIAIEAGVALAFEHVHGGQVSQYLVERRWHQLRSGRIREDLVLSIDGEVSDELTEGSRQDFLDSLLPPSLAGFFLFDGEKIQTLADDENGEYLADAVKRLLGLDLVSQLQVDLRRFAGSANRGRRDKTKRRLEETEAQVSEAQKRVAELAEERAGLQARHDQLAARVERVRERLASEGGSLAAERSALEADARKAAVEVAAAEEELRGLIAGLLPFAISGVIAQSLQDRLELERTAEEDEVVAQRIKAAAPRLRRSLKVDSDRPVPDLLRELLGVGHGPKLPRRHDMSSSERAVLLDQLRFVREGIPQDAKRLTKRLKRAQSRMERTERKLQRVPDDEVLAPLIQELQIAERGFGECSSEIDRIDEERRQADYELKVAERELRRAEEALLTQNQGRRTSQLALRAVALLEEYGELAEHRRLEQIELETTRYFNRLSRKGELLSEVEVDPETFHVRIVRWDGTELPKARLSAGEKQLLAIALLWALANASGRPLPVVVDTPLARLDHEHRRRLLHEYLPHVSHQVVVLSTDTEVDVAVAAELEAVTARKIFLRHDLSSASSSIEEGYFTTSEETSADAR
jgi:DNA sulfur modification protein DndD